MANWQDVKPLIRELACPKFVQRGFVQPGVVMWRHRKDFVDVVMFRKGLVTFSVEFGTTPRLPGVHQPKPEDCHFRGQPGHVLDSRLFDLSVDINQVRENLSALIGPLAAAADKWFGHFESSATAKWALDHNEPFGLSWVCLGRRGSPAYEEALRVMDSMGTSSK